MEMELYLSPEEWTLETVYERILEFSSTEEPKYWSMMLESTCFVPQNGTPDVFRKVKGLTSLYI
jgi:hypothetical protein